MDFTKLHSDLLKIQFKLDNSRGREKIQKLCQLIGCDEEKIRKYWRVMERRKKDKDRVLLEWIERKFPEIQLRSDSECSTRKRKLESGSDDVSEQATELK